MNHAGFGSLVPGRKSFSEESFGGFRIFGRDGGFHATRKGSDFAADFKIVFGMRHRLPVCLECRGMPSCF